MVAFVLVVIAAACAVPGAATAALTIGETAPGGFTPVPCVGPYFAIQTEVGGPPDYTVPAGRGVITSWSIRETDPQSGQIRLKVLQPVAGADYKVVAQSPYVPIPTGFKTFKVRIPVLGGQTIGLWVPGDPITLADCVFETDDPDDHNGSPNVTTEPQPGDTVTPGSDDKVRLNVSAQVEPDLDGNGYGDETQDRADVSLSLSAPPRVTVGALVQYHLTVRNAGFGGARKTVLIDRLPRRAQYVGASNPAGACKAIRGGVACQLGLVRKGASVPITILARLHAPGTAFDAAQVSSPTIDPRSVNNLAAAATSVKCKKGFRFDKHSRKCVKAAGRRA